MITLVFFNYNNVSFSGRLSVDGNFLIADSVDINCRLHPFG